MNKIDLEKIEDPSFLKTMTLEELTELSEQIRTFIIESVSKTGGHLSSNLGVVDLCIAIHYVFNSPDDKILFDVGHQSYTHKILTGRALQFPTLRAFNGLSGYQKRNESEHDSFEAGHSSTSISCAAGMAVARDLDGKDHQIIPVIGDGSMGSGLAFEALNHIAALQTKMIIVLNDNNMSISHNIGGMQNIFAKLRINNNYQKLSRTYSNFMKKTTVGGSILNLTKGVKNTLKYHINLNIFEELGFEYIGPIDGHNIKDLILAFNKAQQENKPVVVHVITKKGKGYAIAENDQSGDWHGTGPFEIATGKPTKTSQLTSWSKIIADAILEQSLQNEDIVTITPAMISGSKLAKNFEIFENRCFDVGIAEEHAVTFASGLALQNKRPFVSIYSSFLQRAYDQVNHDICRMNLPVVFGVDRAGIVGEDGETHHGVFDIGFLRTLPNAIICMPRDASQARAMVSLAFNQLQPFFIRYPRGEMQHYHQQEPIIDVQIGISEEILQGNLGTIISYGPTVNEIASICNQRQLDVKVVDIRFFKPLDSKFLEQLANDDKPIVVLETDVKAGGLTSAIFEHFNELKIENMPVIHTLGIGDHYVVHGSMSDLFELEKIRAVDAVELMEQLLCQK